MIDPTLAGGIIVALLMVLLTIRVQRRVHRQAPARLEIDTSVNTWRMYNGTKWVELPESCKHIGFGPESFMAAFRRLPWPGPDNMCIGPTMTANRQPTPAMQYPVYGGKKEDQEAQEE